ncbi:MAG: hypothetical protein GWN79_10535 [Actinobacteria bacterium]|nr:hypothetical protein [Actinomycetota bacterium]NIS31662.1 hypothetical protein [Actinomycetota bacterium]NIT95804.1 hypothetical protein [Actinomycetota bacterium]NIU19490.1 hypothetical protein [Actinomycetota bacterium]NIU66772.1 hypothetical protein [Actinomycetota bacterium]
MSESIVLLVLGACWAGYLVWYLRGHRQASPDRHDRTRTFAAGMGTLGGSSVRSINGVARPAALVPRTVHDAARRRRDVLISLGAVCVFTLLAAIALGPVALLIHVFADLAFAGYGYAVVQRRNEHAEREMKVHMLYPERRRTPAMARRAVNG